MHPYKVYFKVFFFNYENNKLIIPPLGMWKALNIENSSFLISLSPPMIWPDDSMTYSFSLGLVSIARIKWNSC